MRKRRSTLNWDKPETMVKFLVALAELRNVSRVAAEMGVSDVTVHRKLNDYLARMDDFKARYAVGQSGSQK